MYDVITVGTATRDVFLRSPLFKVVRDPKHLERLGFPTGEAQCFALGGKIEIGKPEFLIGGGAANAAVTFARQGFRTGALVKVGTDFIGKEIVTKLKREGIQPLALFDDKEKGTTAWSAILLSPGGERTILNYRGASEDVVRREVPFSKLGARWAYIAPGRIPFPVMLAIIRSLKKKGVRIAIDPSKYYLKMGPKKLRPILRCLDIIKMNREEASYLTGVSYRDERRIFKKFDELVPGLAVMTDGPKGVLASDGKTIYRAGVFKEKKIVDRTGAGDAFGSGFVTGIMSYEKSVTSYALRGTGTRNSLPTTRFSPEAVRYAIRLGSANATSVVEHIGAHSGILTKRQFHSDRRWSKLEVISHSL